MLAAGGFANTAVQTAFCAGTTCTISIIYDQSPQHNNLTVATKTSLMPTGGLEANATDGQITASGHTVYGIYVTGEANYNTVRAPNVAYRNNATKGIATGDQPESMYMVLDGTRFSAGAVARLASPGGSRTGTYKVSRDPQFASKVRDIVGLYLSWPSRIEPRGRPPAIGQ